MSGSVSVAAQAELMEKEKTVVEHQQRLESLRETIKTMANRQVTLKRAKRRAEITISELTRLPAEHAVYRGIGRAFVRASVRELVDSNSELIERSEAEDSRLSQEKQRAGETVMQEEAQLRRAVDEYRSVVQLVQAMQSRNGSSNSQS